MDIKEYCDAFYNQLARSASPDNPINEEYLQRLARKVEWEAKLDGCVFYRKDDGEVVPLTKRELLHMVRARIIQNARGKTDEIC